LHRKLESKKKEQNLRDRVSASHFFFVKYASDSSISSDSGLKLQEMTLEHMTDMTFVRQLNLSSYKSI